MRAPCPSSTRDPSALDKPDRADAARAYGAARGYTSRGGWIYGPGGARLARGWDALASDLIKVGAILPIEDGARFAVAPAPAQEQEAGISAPATSKRPASATTTLKQEADATTTAAPAAASTATTTTTLDQTPAAAGASGAEQETIAVKRPGPRRPAKSTTTPPATEAPAVPPVLPPVPAAPGNPVKAPPKRPRPAPSAALDPYAADAELPGMEPTTREQVRARREVGARHFLDAVTHVLSGRPAAAQHSLIESRGAFRRAAYEAEVLATAEHREAAALDAQDPEALALDAAEQEEQGAAGAEREQEHGGELLELQEAGEGGELSAPRPEIAGLARTLIRERSGGGTSGTSGAQGGDPGTPAAPSTKRGAAAQGDLYQPETAPALSPELEALAAPWRAAAAAQITSIPERPGGGEAEHVALPRMTPIPPVHPRPQPAGESTPPPRPKRKPPASSKMSAPRPAAAPLDRRAATRLVVQEGLSLDIPVHVAELARFSLGVGVRAGIFPPEYEVRDFIVDAVFERGSILAESLALRLNPGARWGLADRGLFMGGEGDADHCLILDR